MLFIDASELYWSSRNHNTLEPEHGRQIYEWYRVISLDEIAGNDWNLNIPRYVEPVIEEETISVTEALANLQEALAESYAAEERLRQLLCDAGLMKPEAEP